MDIGIWKLTSHGRPPRVLVLASNLQDRKAEVLLDGLDWLGRVEVLFSDGASIRDHDRDVYGDGNVGVYGGGIKLKFEALGSAGFILG